jgi:hypothetical protein
LQEERYKKEVRKRNEERLEKRKQQKAERAKRQRIEATPMVEEVEDKDEEVCLKDVFALLKGL